jgi:hypothetical protein
VCVATENGLSDFLSPAACDECEQAQTRQQHAISVRLRNRRCKRRVATAAIEREAEVSPAQRKEVITLPVLVKAALRSRICVALGLTKKPAKAGFGTKLASTLAAGRRESGNVPVSETLPGDARLPVANVILGAPVTSKSPSLLLSANVVTRAHPTADSLSS